uniref:group I truncated hemoglobin n=1 Tax=Ningiella ruwaisensis TaxID=2364274 RepID=UPI001F4FA7EA|nr:group 1 truncated hemoglobin [Ningiella ruwaisensis]
MMLYRSFYRFILVLGSCVLLQACQSTTTSSEQSLYLTLGGQSKVEEIVDNFIYEIEFNPQIFPYFTNTNVERFREKLIEHLCMLTQGPCEYTGDTMVQVHTGMNITEHDFNLGVDLFIKAMEKADIPHRVQNRVLQTMAPTRKDIIYL